MKLPLVGQSYALRSPAASCQQTMNLIPELLEAEENGKNKGILVGAPGYHLVQTLDSPIRGEWAGDGGYAYVVGGNKLYQLSIGSYVPGNPGLGTLTIVNSWTFDVASDGKPAWLGGNGRQLAIIVNGYFYIDNGSGPVRAQFQINGYVNTNGTAVTWTDGDDFSTLAASGTFLIDGTAYTISSVDSTTALTLTGTAGVQNGAYFGAAAGGYVTAVMGAVLDGYFIVQRPSGSSLSGRVDTAGRIATRTSGPLFTTVFQNGDPIVINGVGYTIQWVASSTQLFLLQDAGTQTGVAYAAGADLGRQFNVSGPGDGTYWDPLDFASKEANADYLQSLLADREQLYLWGTSSAEVWQASSSPLFPFQRIPGAATREGSFCRWTTVSLAGHIFFIGGPPHGQPAAYRLDGFTPVRISTPAEEEAWSTDTSLSTAVAFEYIQDGHSFWVINFTNQAWVYDTQTEMWHQRAKWSGSAFTAYEPRFHCYISGWGLSGVHLVGGSGSGNLYDLSPVFPDDNDSTQQWKRVLPHLYAQNHWQYFNRMVLEMDTGSTTSTTVQPTVSRTFSDDRGKTFGNAESPLTGGSGVKDATGQVVFWPNAGASKDRVFAFTGNNKGNSRTVLIDLDCEIEEGTT